VPGRPTGGEHLLRGFRVAAVEKRDVGALCGEQQRYRAADAAAAAGDDRALARDAGVRPHVSGHPEIANRRRRPSVWPLTIAASGKQRR
jgi:hypothetical protein